MPSGAGLMAWLVRKVAWGVPMAVSVCLTSLPAMQCRLGDAGQLLGAAVPC